MPEPTGHAAALEVLTFGRAGVDIYPLQVGVGLEDVRRSASTSAAPRPTSPSPRPGSGPRRGIITGVGDDPFGRYVRRRAARPRGDDAHVVTNHTYATPVTFCEIFPPDDFPLYFYRKPTAPGPAGAGPVRHRPRRRPRPPH